MRERIPYLRSAVSIEFGMYLLVGFISTGFDIGSYFLLTRYAFEDAPLVSLKATSFILGSICSFALNRRFTFNMRDPICLRQVSRFYAMVLTSLTVNALAFSILHSIFMINDMLAAIFAVSTSFFVGFSLSKAWVFRRERTI